LFATGAIQILAERGDIVRDNSAWRLKQPLVQIELDAPVSMRSVIEKKVSLLSDSQRQALVYASIEGEEFTSTVLAALLQADDLELEDRLHTIEAVHRLIRVKGEEDLPDGSAATRYRFAHALYQYYLYDQILSKRRVLLHLRAGQTLERIMAASKGVSPALWQLTSNAAAIFPRRSPTSSRQVIQRCRATPLPRLSDTSRTVWV